MLTTEFIGKNWAAAHAGAAGPVEWALLGVIAGALCGISQGRLIWRVKLDSNQRPPA